MGLPSSPGHGAAGRATVRETDFRDRADPPVASQLEGREAPFFLLERLFQVKPSDVAQCE